MKRPCELRPFARRLARERARRLVEAVAWRTRVPIEQLMVPSPAPDRHRARAACAWLIRRIDGLAYREIAMVLGRSDHSMARYLVRRGEDLRETDWAIRMLTDLILGEQA